MESNLLRVYTGFYWRVVGLGLKARASEFTTQITTELKTLSKHFPWYLLHVPQEFLVAVTF